jgi:hypothetical protein
LDDKLLKVSVMVCLLGKNKGSKTIFIIYFLFIRKNKKQKREIKKAIEA